LSHSAGVRCFPVIGCSTTRTACDHALLQVSDDFGRGDDHPGVSLDDELLFSPFGSVTITLLRKRATPFRS
jgi:hypothetical protein